MDDVQSRVGPAVKGTRGAHSVAEAIALMKAAAQEPQGPHLADFIQLALHTGMRQGEMLGLEWRRVDLKQGLIYLDAVDQKNGKHGSVPVNSEAERALLSRARFRASHCPDSKWVFCNKRDRVSQKCEKASSVRVVKLVLRIFICMICDTHVQRGWCKPVYRFGKLRRCYDMPTFA